MANPQSLPPSPSISRIDWRRVAASPWTIGLGVSCLLAAIACVSLQRTFLGVEVESDFTGAFAREAQRMLKGEPLALLTHPPGYPFVVAMGRVLSGDWLDGALWISGISAAIVLVASIATFRRLAGTAASWGALLACACSLPFLAYASTASSDMYFAALVYVLLGLIVHALAAPRRLLTWTGCGAIAACVLLTRTNGMVAAAVLALPWLVPAHEANRSRNFAALAVGFLMPLVAWGSYAASTDSPWWPVGNYRNIAVAAFVGGSGGWHERVAALPADIQNLADVLAYDPARLVSRLATNLALLPAKAALTLTWIPFTILAAPGLVLVLLRRRTPALLACLSLIAGMTLLTGILGYLARHYLMLVPLIGAMAGVAFAWVLDRGALGQAPRVLLTLAAFLVAGIVGARTYAKVLPQLETEVQVEFSQAASYLMRQTEPDAVIVARNYSISISTGRNGWFLANFSTLSALYDDFCHGIGATSPAYLFIGEMERRYRSDLVRELSSRPISWLEPVAHGTTSSWTLYRIRLDQAQDMSCSSSSAT